MGDISELRGLLFAGTFILLAVFLIAAIPSGFVASYEEGLTPDIPEFMDAKTLVAWNTTETIYWSGLTPVSFPPGGTIYSQEWGKASFGHHMRFQMWNFSGSGGRFVQNQHGQLWLGFGFFELKHNMEWINKTGFSRGENLYLEEVETDMGANNYAEYIVECSDFYIDAVFSYNNTFANITDAWNNDGCAVVFGIDWNQKGTTHDAWSLVSSLLSLDPSITGNIWIDTVIKIPIMIASMYIGFILVLRAIGALFGGGA